VLDRYRLERRLGAGGFGTVWAAHDERLDREVAVKIVPRQRVLKGRFEREARTAARLSHPAIVTLYEAWVDEQDAYLVTELVHGHTLAMLLQAGRLSDRDVVAIALSLADALAHAHANGVVHRDVKPSNVLVPERPNSPAHPAKLTDFGVARVIGGDSLTGTGEVVGTAAYMAPEQAEGREASAAADLYALALVTYEGLTSVNPVRTGTAAMRARRLGAHLPPLRRQRRDLPQELARAIDLALRPRPRERGRIEDLEAALIESLPRLRDDPGIVTAGWPLLSRLQRSPSPDGDPQLAPPAEHAPPGYEDPKEAAVDEDPSPLAAFGARTLASVATAATAAFLASYVPDPSIRGPTTTAAAAIASGLTALPFPRAAWIILTAAAATAGLAAHSPGAALLVTIMALTPVILLPRSGVRWSLGAGALALGLVGLAGAWPAVASISARTAWRRAALALTGWIWLALAAPLVARNLYTQLPPGAQLRPATDPQAWLASPASALHDILVPLLRGNVLLSGFCWVAAACALPRLIRPDSTRGLLLRILAWSSLTLGATLAALALAGHHPLTPSPRVAVAGALAAFAMALIYALPKAWRTQRQRRGLDPELP
jgi:serine/threonine protein kinase